MQRKFSENQNCAKRAYERLFIVLRAPSNNGNMKYRERHRHDQRKILFCENLLPEKCSYFRFNFATSNGNSVKIETVRNALAHERLVFSRTQPKSKPKV